MKAEIAVHETSGGWFQVITAYRSIDQNADFISVNFRLFYGLLRSHRGSIRRLCTVIPEAPRKDSRDFFHQSGMDTQAFHGWLQPVPDFCRGHFYWGIYGSKRLNYNVFKLHVYPGSMSGAVDMRREILEGDIVA
jgi:hypothetical protein